jgi:putative glutamine amidotransferase
MHVSGGSHRPRIGMVADRRPASFGAWRDVDVTFAWGHYVDGVAGAGGAPLLFPVEECFERAPELALDAADALLLTGGRDIDAAAYGAESHPANEVGDPLRDRMEMALARLALDRGLPILGVCRGMQLLNVVCGGGIDQHLDDPDRVHRADPGAFAGHRVEPVPGTRLAEILGTEPVAVRSHHHQGIGQVADGFVVAARSDDGVTEALEAPDRAFCLSVLWHPEEDLPGGGEKLYEALVEAARERTIAGAR